MVIETWDRSALREQEQIIGRSKAEGAPLSGGTEFTEPDFGATGGGGTPLIADDSHVRLAHPSLHGGARMLRRGYNFTDGNDTLGRLDAGLFFAAFVRDPGPASSRSRTRSPGPTPCASTSCTPGPACTRCRRACRRSARTDRSSATPTSGPACSPEAALRQLGQPPASPVPWPPFRWCMPRRYGRTWSGSTRAISSLGSLIRCAMSPRSRNVAVSSGENSP